jgi:hypothetical protein
MQIRTQTTQVSRSFTKVSPPGRDSPNPVPSPVSTDRRDRISGGVFGAALLGGSAALGCYYHGPGVAGAAGLAGLSSVVLGVRADVERVGFCGFVTAAIAAGAAAGGQAMGPGFAAVAGAVGGVLGYIVCGKDSD